MAHVVVGPCTQCKCGEGNTPGPLTLCSCTTVRKATLNLSGLTDFTFTQVRVFECFGVPYNYTFTWTVNFSALNGSYSTTELYGGGSSIQAVFRLGKPCDLLDPGILIWKCEHVTEATGLCTPPCGPDGHDFYYAWALTAEISCSACEGGGYRVSMGAVVASLNLDPGHEIFLPCAQVDLLCDDLQQQIVGPTTQLVTTCFESTCNRTASGVDEIGVEVAPSCVDDVHTYNVGATASMTVS